MKGWKVVDAPVSARVLLECKVLNGQAISPYDRIDFQLNGEPVIITTILNRSTMHALRWNGEEKRYEWKGLTGAWIPACLVRPSHMTKGELIDWLYELQKSGEKLLWKGKEVDERQLLLALGEKVGNHENK